jgi:hypothetical protein
MNTTVNGNERSLASRPRVEWRAGAAEMRCIPYTRIRYGLHMRTPAVEVLPIHRYQIAQINLLFSS